MRRLVRISIYVLLLLAILIGSAAIAHLLPALDYVDLDGPLLLKEDLATGIVFEQGRVRCSGQPGLGIVPDLGIIQIP